MPKAPAPDVYAEWNAYAARCRANLQIPEPRRHPDWRLYQPSTGFYAEPALHPCIVYLACSPIQDRTADGFLAFVKRRESILRNHRLNPGQLQNDACALLRRLVAEEYVAVSQNSITLLPKAYELIQDLLPIGAMAF